MGFIGTCRRRNPERVADQPCLATLARLASDGFRWQFYLPMHSGELSGIFNLSTPNHGWRSRQLIVFPFRSVQPHSQSRKPFRFILKHFFLPQNIGTGGPAMLSPLPGLRLRGVPLPVNE